MASKQPEALRLADELEDVIDEVPLPRTRAEFRASVARLISKYKEQQHG